MSAAARLDTFVDSVLHNPGIRAVLLYGESGSGTTEVAERLVRQWMFSNPDKASAVDLAKSVDFQRVVPWGPSRLIKLSAMKTVKSDTDAFPGIPILEFFRTRPLMSDRKVALFHDVERMNGDSANAFLKTLEELPEHAAVVLTTQEIGAVLPTVRSRCLCVPCGSELNLGQLNEVERTFARTPGQLVAVRDQAEVYEGLYDALRVSVGRGGTRALWLAERLKEYASALTPQGGAARTGNANVLEAVGLYVSVWAPHRPDWASATAEAHRIVLGNGNAAFVYDWLCSTLTQTGN